MAKILSNSILEEVRVLIRSASPVSFVETPEEERFLRCVRHVARSVSQERSRNVVVWTISRGFDPVDDFLNPAMGESERRVPIKNPLKALQYIISDGFAPGTVWVFLDMGHFLKEDAALRRILRDVVRRFFQSESRAILVDVESNVPKEFESDTVFYRMPRPTADELLECFKSIIDAGISAEVDLGNGDLEQISQAVAGLTENEAVIALGRSIVRVGRLSSDCIPYLLEHKKMIIERGGLLEFYPADTSLADVGGYDELKKWIRVRGRAFSPRAREFGLPSPRAVMLIGVQGCGKSLASKAIAGVWGYPCLKVNMGRIVGQFLGQTERRSLEVIEQAESIAPCVLWIDEIEKAFAGGTGASTDSGTTSRMLGIWLNWLQEKTKPVFVVATANDISALPPEMLRKGRFDEIFFVDLPSLREREEIFRIHLEKRGRDPGKFKVSKLAEMSEGFSGSEIEQAIVSAMFSVFDRYGGEKDITFKSIAKEIRSTVPLSATRREDIESLRGWARSRARMASRIRARSTRSTPRRMILGE